MRQPEKVCDYKILRSKRRPQNTQAANTNNKRMKCVDITRSKTRAATNFRISVKNTERKNKQPEKVCDYKIPRSKRRRPLT